MNIRARSAFTLTAIAGCLQVLAQEEYDAGHLEGCKLIPIDEVEARIAEFGEDRGKPVVLY